MEDEMMLIQLQREEHSRNLESRRRERLRQTLAQEDIYIGDARASTHENPDEGSQTYMLGSVTEYDRQTGHDRFFTGDGTEEICTEGVRNRLTHGVNSVDRADTYNRYEGIEERLNRTQGDKPRRSEYLDTHSKNASVSEQIKSQDRLNTKNEKTSETDAKSKPQKASENLDSLQSLDEEIQDLDRRLTLLQEEGYLPVTRSKVKESAERYLKEETINKGQSRNISTNRIVDSQSTKVKDHGPRYQEAGKEGTFTNSRIAGMTGFHLTIQGFLDLDLNRDSRRNPDVTEYEGVANRPPRHGDVRRKLKFEEEGGHRYQRVPETGFQRPDHYIGKIMENICDEQRSLFRPQYEQDRINANYSGGTPYTEAELKRQIIKNTNPMLDQNERIESTIKREMDFPV